MLEQPELQATPTAREQDAAETPETPALPCTWTVTDAREIVEMQYENNRGEITMRDRGEPEIDAPIQRTFRWRALPGPGLTRQIMGGADSSAEAVDSLCRALIRADERGQVALENETDAFTAIVSIPR